MNPLDTEFHRRLTRLLAERLQTDIQNLASGQMDHEEYKRACGYIKALQDVGEWCIGIETDINEGK